MESIQFGGRRAPGFGVGVAPESVLVRAEEAVTRPVQRKVGAFVGGAMASGIAAVAATALFGDGFGALSGAVPRLRRNWRSIAATTAIGGVIGAIAS
jgi:hypothetical protein